MAAVGADTWGLEVIPFEKNQGVFEVHQILLPMNGIYILENMNTEEMVKDKAWEFLFTLGPRASPVLCRRSSIPSRSSSADGVRRPASWATKEYLRRDSALPIRGPHPRQRRQP